MQRPINTCVDSTWCRWKEITPLSYPILLRPIAVFCNTCTTSKQIWSEIIRDKVKKHRNQHMLPQRNCQNTPKEVCVEGFVVC